MAITTLILIILVGAVLIYAITQISMPPMLRNALWIILAIIALIVLLGLLGVTKL